MGVMLYELCALRPPFEGRNMHALQMQIVRGKYSPIPSCFSSEMRQLINACLSQEERKRPTVNDILNLPLIQKRIKNHLSQSLINNEFCHTVLHKHDVFSVP